MVMLVMMGQLGQLVHRELESKDHKVILVYRVIRDHRD
jgi:hypothetical protein